MKTKVKNGRDIVYHVEYTVKTFDDDPKESHLTEFKADFSDDSPLSARQRAFEYFERLEDASQALRSVSFLYNICTPAEISQRGRKNFSTYFSHVSWEDTIEETGEMIISGDYEEDAMNLATEYRMYKRNGFDTVETMKHDGQTILFTDCEELEIDLKTLRKLKLDRIK